MLFSLSSLQYYSTKKKLYQHLGGPKFQPWGDLKKWGGPRNYGGNLEPWMKPWTKKRLEGGGRKISGEDLEENLINWIHERRDNRCSRLF